MIVSVVCQNCGHSFPYDPARHNGKGRFCSQQCVRTYLTLHPPALRRECGKCGEPLSTEKVYTAVNGTVRCKRCGSQVKVKIQKALNMSINGHIIGLKTNIYAEQPYSFLNKKQLLNKEAI